MKMETTGNSLRKMCSGTIIFLAGTAVSLLFGFINRIFIARYGTEAQYGIYSVSIIIFEVCVMVACLGLQEGASRYIAYHLEKRDRKNTADCALTAIQIAGLGGLVIAAILFFSADAIAVNIFHDINFSKPLRILAIGIPFAALSSIFVAIFRGFGRAQEKVLFQDISLNVLFFLMLIPVLFFTIPFSWVYYAYLAATILCCIILGFYTFSKITIGFNFNLHMNFQGKDLLLFSSPLIFVSMMQMVLGYSDTLLLGSLKSDEIAGLYNSALPLSQLIAIPSTALLFNFVPNISGLFASNQMAEVGKNYSTVTKWIFMSGLPLLALGLLFPADLLRLTFGESYVSAGLTMQILFCGFFIANIMGPNGTTLMVIGETRFLMWASLAAMVLNIILIIALIPLWGIVGAAVGTSISLFFNCILRLIRLRRYFRFNLLSTRLILPALLYLGIVVGVSFLLKGFIEIRLWMLLLLVLVFYILYFGIVLFSRNFDEADYIMLAEIAHKSGLDIGPLKHYVRKKFFHT